MSIPIIWTSLFFGFWKNRELWDISKFVNVLLHWEEFNLRISAFLQIYRRSQKVISSESNLQISALAQSSEKDQKKKHHSHMKLRISVLPPAIFDEMHKMLCGSHASFAPTSES